MVDKDPALVKFGESVRSRRTTLGLSQDEFADQAGIHRTFISGIERGVRNPGLLSILIIAKALKCDAGDLLKGVRL